jgi:hypothetical protein
VAVPKAEGMGKKKVAALGRKNNMSPFPKPLQGHRHPT